jgi:hypothetical protein
LFLCFSVDREFPQGKEQLSCNFAYVICVLASIGIPLVLDAPDAFVGPDDDDMMLFQVQGAAALPSSVYCDASSLFTRSALFVVPYTYCGWIFSSISCTSTSGIKPQACLTVTSDRRESFIHLWVY